jgi:hypothetical protein
MVLGNLKDILGAFTDVYDQKKLNAFFYLVLVLAWIAVVLALAVICRRQVRVAITLLQLRSWCSRRGYSRLGDTIAEQIQRLIWSWTTYLDSTTASTGVQPEGWVVATNALVTAYLEGLADLQTGNPLGGSRKGHPSEASEPLLPSNFLLYAHCVEKIRENTSSTFNTSSGIKVAIRTLLTQDITRWYNIQRLHLPGDKMLWCSTLWWEHYKLRIHHSNLEPHGICLHRLLRYDASAPEGTFDDQKRYLRLHIRKEFASQRECLSAEEFVEVKTQLDDAGFGGALTWLSGAEHIRVATNQVPEFRIHPICKVDPLSTRAIQNWIGETSRYALTSAFEDYRTYHNTFGRCHETPTKAGAWGKQIDKGILQAERSPFIKEYDDLFLVDFYRVDGDACVGRFGISFRIEEHKDIAGIRMLSPTDVTAAVEQFDDAWARASAL